MYITSNFLWLLREKICLFSLHNLSLVETIDVDINMIYEEIKSFTNMHNIMIFNNAQPYIDYLHEQANIILHNIEVCESIKAHETEIISQWDNTAQQDELPEWVADFIFVEAFATPALAAQPTTSAEESHKAQSSKSTQSDESTATQQFQQQR